MLQQLYQRLLSKIAMVAPGGTSVRPMLHRLRGVKVGDHVWISQYVYIDELHPEVISIGNNSSIGLRTSLITHFYWGPRRSSEHAGPIVIEDDVFIGPHCVILPGVKIGRGAVIKAGTVVSRNIPAGTFWSTPAPEPLAKVGIPLTWQHEYDEFMKGLRLIRKSRPAPRPAEPVREQPEQS